MVRTTKVVLASMILWGCKGGSNDDDDDDGVSDDPPVVLSTVSGEYDVDVDVVDNSCGGDATDLFRSFTIKLDQVSTGLWALVDEDVGWVPCDGSVDAFECRWGNGPSDAPEQIWRWSLVGVATAQEVEATLTLAVSCDDGQCEPCSIVAEYTGPFDPQS